MSYWRNTPTTTFIVLEKASTSATRASSSVMPARCPSQTPSSIRHRQPHRGARGRPRGVLPRGGSRGAARLYRDARLGRGHPAPRAVPWLARPSTRLRPRFRAGRRSSSAGHHRRRLLRAGVCRRPPGRPPDAKVTVAARPPHPRPSSLGHDEIAVGTLDPRADVHAIRMGGPIPGQRPGWRRPRSWCLTDAASRLGLSVPDLGSRIPSFASSVEEMAWARPTGGRPLTPWPPRSARS
jgi:hypothetical protein